jgi:hypothetical protein
MNHTIQRHRRLYGLFHETGTEKFREELVFSFSHGRTHSSGDLSDLEVDELIKHLEKMTRKEHAPTHSGVDYKGQQMRRRILSLCYNIGWVTWNTGKGKHEIDWPRLNGWMLKYGYLHKPMNDYTYTELQRLVKQFENMATAALSPSKTPQS